MLPKSKDLGMFSFCMIENKQVKNGMLDLGVSINVISLNVYKNLGLNDCRKKEKKKRKIIKLH